MQTQTEIDTNLLKVYNRVKRKRAKEKLHKRLFNRDVDNYGNNYDKIGICELCNETQKLRHNRTTSEMLCDVCDIATNHSVKAITVNAIEYTDVFDLINDYRVIH